MTQEPGFKKPGFSFGCTMRGERMGNYPLGSGVL
jgi:hypothetical protein